MSEYGVLDLDNDKRVPIVVTVPTNPLEILGEILCALWHSEE